MAHSLSSGASEAELEGRFERDIEGLIGAARCACLRLLPWADQEHDNIIQEALKRVLHNLRAGKLHHAEADLEGYVYGVTRNCIREAKRRLYRDEVRACALPEHDEIWYCLLVEEGDSCCVELDSLPPDEMRARLLQALRYYVVHMFSTATEKKRRQALRDTYILARHHLRGVPLVRLADELGITRRACQYALERTSQNLLRLFDPQTGDVRSFVENSMDFKDITELTDFLRTKPA